MLTSSENTSSLWVTWTISCAIGELLGMVAVAAISFGVNTLWENPESTGDKIGVLVCMMGAGLLEGAVLGYFQWRVLRKKFQTITASAWMLQTILIAVLGWMLGMLPSLFFIEKASHTPDTTAQLPDGLFAILIIGSGLLLGALLGLFQWFELKYHASGAVTWITANAIGWGIGMSCIYFFASLPDEFTPILETAFYVICGGVLAGLSIGAITGICLVKMQKR